jgi:Fe-S-cluster-containing dehydrogenase component/CRP-like cAMP-binding protein
MKQRVQDSIAIDRPVRWDHPLDPAMLGRDIQWMLDQPPFAEMNREVFPSHSSLEDVLRHDCRILRYEPGDILIREGDYGSSAFLVLRGSVRVFLESLWNAHGQPVPQNDPFWTRLMRSLGISKAKSPRPSEYDQRRHGRQEQPDARGGSVHRTTPVQNVASEDGRSRIFLQDIAAVIQDYQSEPLGVGEIFGEMAAITRSQHRYTVVASKPTVVLEIRWQGLRILRRDKKFRDYLDERFRETSLQTQLRETPLFRFLNDDAMQHVIESTRIESVGDREWFAEYRDAQKFDVQKQIELEPVIVNEGQPVHDLILIRAGFARLSFELGRGHQTIAYLGRGQMHGLAEIVSNFRDGENRPLPYQESLRALGFVDILRIPRDVVTRWILPNVRSSELPRPIVHPRYDSGGLVIAAQDNPTNKASQADDQASYMETSLIEFLVDERLINGKQTMLIDLDRCTGCDECVKACAATHHGTPRFVRNGPQYGPLLFAHACMHCTDPVCMIGCPTGAIARNQETGIISIDPNTCIGCKTCAQSCPYDNIVMLQVHDKQGRAAVDRQTQLPILQASKCDLCPTSTTGPACQSSCPHNALFRLDTSDVQVLNQWLKKRAA